MAATDTVLVRKVYNDGVTGSTNGVAETVNLADFLQLLPTAAGSGSVTAVTRVAAPAAAPAAFADLTAAATAYNAMRTALINSGVFLGP